LSHRGVCKKDTGASSDDHQPLAVVVAIRPGQGDEAAEMRRRQLRALARLIVRAGEIAAERAAA